jgi:hypothetical protein
MQQEQHGAAAAVSAALAAIGATDADASGRRTRRRCAAWRARQSGRALHCVWHAAGPPASVALDFPFADAGPGGLNLLGDNRLLERMHCFHDPDVGASSDWLVVVRVHTLLKWGDRKKWAAGQRLRQITSVSTRHSTRGAGGGWQQERRKFDLVPWNPSPSTYRCPCTLPPTGHKRERERDHQS